MFLSLKTLYRKKDCYMAFTLHNYTDFIEKIGDNSHTYKKSLTICGSERIISMLDSLLRVL